MLSSECSISCYYCCHLSSSFIHKSQLEQFRFGCSHSSLSLDKHPSSYDADTRRVHPFLISNISINRLLCRKAIFMISTVVFFKGKKLDDDSRHADQIRRKVRVPINTNCRQFESEEFFVYYFNSWYCLFWWDWCATYVSGGIVGIPAAATVKRCAMAAVILQHWHLRRHICFMWLPCKWSAAS